MAADCSQILVVRWSLHVLNVWLLFHFDTVVRQLLIRDLISAITEFTGSLPMPGESSHMLESSHLLIGQVSDDFEHLTAIAIDSEYFALNFWLHNQLPAEHITENGTANKELGLHHIPHD